MKFKNLWEKLKKKKTAKEQDLSFSPKLILTGDIGDRERDDIFREHEEILKKTLAPEFERSLAFFKRIAWELSALHSRVAFE